MKITNGQLAEIVNNLLTNPYSGECDNPKVFEQFCTDIAQVVCDYCGGEIVMPASDVPKEERMGWTTHYRLEVQPNESSPEGGGVWASNIGTAARSAKFLVEITDESYVPEDGDAFDAVVSALNHFEIPTYVREVGQPLNADQIDNQPMQEHTVYFEAYACDDYGDGPGYAVLTVSQQFCDKLKHLQKMAGEFGLSELRTYASPDAYGPGDIEENLRLTCGELVVTPTMFWFTDHPKHIGYNIETRSQSIDGFIAAVAEGKQFFGNDLDDLRKRVEEENEEA